MSILFYFNTNFLYHNVHVPFVSTNFNFYQSFFTIYTTVLHYTLTDKTILILISISKPLLCFFFDFSREATSHSFSEKRPKDSRASIVKTTACEGTKLGVLFILRPKFNSLHEKHRSLILVRKHISFVL